MAFQRRLATGQGLHDGNAHSQAVMTDRIGGNGIGKCLYGTGQGGGGATEMARISASGEADMGTKESLSAARSS